jgi:hypothetical protein
MRSDQSRATTSGACTEKDVTHPRAAHPAKALRPPARKIIAYLWRVTQYLDLTQDALTDQIIGSGIYWMWSFISQNTRKAIN